jgi:hypothetical protein
MPSTRCCVLRRHGAGGSLSGDEDEAKAEVAAVLAASGFAPIDLGGLHAGGLLQQVGGPLASADLRLAD